ncbi:hypothetical protein F7018_00915 [Tenacibaculum aiptasiae]|uniref:Uncharacterized protein n=1 Tax=Tenacibaculum aiptasiae TaxID=426481 RepID=A0A7J5ASD1_9FLAO|nr:hypothetical protein [Tenacibaculum aiptasiae]KAB1160469.1 hypothetical protein F7018_00915 [Tenacibaculum aiptasiae]
MNQQLIFIILFFILLSCKQNTTNQSQSVKAELQTDLTLEEKEIKEPITTVESKIERWFEPTKLDTILHFNNSYSIILKNTDSIPITEYFLEIEVLDSLTTLHNNSHRTALEIEKYLLNINKEFAKKDSAGLHLKMTNNNWKLISLDPNTDETDNTFEHYFKDFGFYSVRTQWGEGNGYKLINDISGETTKLFGRPYFSENGKFLISVNSDIEAGYSNNGFQLFQNINGKLKNIGSYKPDGWGPFSAKWIDNSTVILKNKTIEFKNEEMNYLNFYSQLKINNSN